MPRKKKFDNRIYSVTFYGQKELQIRAEDIVKRGRNEVIEFVSRNAKSKTDNIYFVLENMYGDIIDWCSGWDELWDSIDEFGIAKRKKQEVNTADLYGSEYELNQKSLREYLEERYA